MENYCRSGRATDGNIIWRMRFARWIPKTADTHSEYVILTAFQVQQWVHEGSLMLSYTYIACLV